MKELKVAVLSSEKQEDYAALFADFVTRLNPRDAIEMQLVAYLVYAAWLIKHTRHQKLTVERYEGEIKQIQDRMPSELEHNCALEKSAAFRDQLDKWLKNAPARFEDTLQVFEYYRNELGQKLRQVTAQILTAEFKDVVRRLEQTGDAPPLVPGDEMMTKEGIQPEIKSEE
jgi:hypothetical protein